VGSAAPALTESPAGGNGEACDDRSWVAGTVDLCAGALVYRDYVYDDYGANTNNPLAPNIAGLARPAGDERYPADVNSADLLTLELRPAGDRLHVTFRLNTLFAPDSTVAALAIDTDGAGSVRPWPGLDVRSDGWDVFAAFDRGDATSNVIEGDLPLPGGTRWRVQAVTAVKGGPVMNVAFRGTDETGPWWEDNQAAALEAGDVSAFGHVVEVADLTSGATRRAPVGPGLYERVYRSDHTVPPGEGVTYAGVPGRNGESGEFAQSFHYLGSHQPYGIYVPATPAPHGVHLVMHGYSANHGSLVNFEGMRQNMGDALDRILVVPLGRGPGGFYSDYSERDVLDVMADVERTYAVDADRVFAGGYSMGGYGTLRFATLYPDRFAGYTNWVGFPGDCFAGTPFVGSCRVGAVGNPMDMVGNLRWVPGANLYAGADELVWVWTGVGLNQALQAAGVPYVYYLHPVAEHLTLAALDDWRKEAAYTKDLRRVHNPPRVTYRTDASLGNPALGIAHDRAYWVSAIRTRTEGAGTVDLTTHGCGGILPVLESQPGAGVDPVPWVSQAEVVVGETPIERGDRLEGTLTNVGALRVDVDAACLSGGPITYRITTDGPVELLLSDGRTLSLPAAGSHEGVVPAPAPVAEGARVAGVAQVAVDRLPATGAGTAPWGLPLAAAGLALAVLTSLSRDRRVGSGRGGWGSTGR
jgi:predicted esterase